MSFVANQRTEDNLAGVADDLTKVMRRSFELCDIEGLEAEVIHGLRTVAEETKYVAAGKSQTMDSRHLYGFAVDIAILIDGKINWDVKYYIQYSKFVLQAAKEFDIDVEWGGDWTTLKDYGHFQLSKKSYPNPKQLNA